MSILSRVVINEGVVDSVVCKDEGKRGEYTVKSFVQVFYKNKEHGRGPNMYNFTKTLWKSLVPPRVELIMWFVILEKLNTRERLVKCGVLQQYMEALRGETRLCFESWMDYANGGSMKDMWIICCVVLVEEPE
ncbi:hypothetical protein PIB30_027257 [Stylosanthes scabra]|uniref:Reverse transcriptase zinc-binding domain-containing protein n=1 Tax=Stylosanthes scabra TaxID=79078 RepID=A0ABU6W8W5_9FABA|nr:hypothetical protein [Stylosanthes scabra]